jgi:hypothetical protein
MGQTDLHSSVFIYMLLSVAMTLIQAIQSKAGT